MLKGSIDGKVILKPETVREMQADQVGVAKVTPGEYVERALGKHHTGIYGFGEWRELVDDVTGEAYQISSPGWAGAYLWINKRDSVYGFFLRESHYLSFGNDNSNGNKHNKK